MRRARPICASRRGGWRDPAPEVLDGEFDTIRELEPSGPNSLMPLSSKALWEAEIITPISQAHGARQHRHAGGGDGAREHHIHADEVKPAPAHIRSCSRRGAYPCQSARDGDVHRAGRRALRPARPECQFGRDLAVRSTANAVCPEKFACHGSNIPFFGCPSGSFFQETGVPQARRSFKSAALACQRQC